ncbi:MAG: AraC family transcriptional regulator [Actinomycetia bacterium]|nr:AraC family transcriptional regulator [Actinomycetes bacterium]
MLTWNLEEPHRQRVLTHPAVHLTFTTYERGPGRARIAGVVRGEFTEEISGIGRVVGVRFRPGGFRPFLGAPVSTITDRFPGVDEVFGAESLAVAEEIFTIPEATDAIALLEEFLQARAPAPDPVVDEVAGMVARIAADSSIIRVGELAQLLDVPPRRLQRLFNEYVGVGPKWVIRRYRMHEAAERAAESATRGTCIDWAGLAAELGYADQAHFTRDFTATVGRSPAQYARMVSA